MVILGKQEKQAGSQDIKGMVVCETIVARQVREELAEIRPKGRKWMCHEPGVGSESSKCRRRNEASLLEKQQGKARPRRRHE